MADNDELQILATVALDLAKSLTQIQQQMKTLQAQMQGYTLKLTAGLDKAASRTKINADAKSLKATDIKLTGQLDKTATTKQLKDGISKLKEQQVKLQGVLDRAATRRNLQAELKTIPAVQATASVKTEGAEQIEKLRQSMTEAKNSAVELAAKTYLVRTALQALRQTARDVIDNISELDSSATNLAIITGGRSAETYKLLEQYNALARDLGATTTQVADAAAAWLRQGKNAAETAELIEKSIMLSKVAMIDSETATKNLTSAMKGYGLAVEDVAGIVDKLAALDSKAAITASDLAVAMSQTASSANIGGVSMDRLLGYLAAVQETTQRSAETIGQSFKTIFARMGNIKLGKFFDDEGNDLSDVESSLTHYGIALRNAEGDFRNFGDVLDEVYDKWEKFRAVDQRAIAQAFAGTRQQENFLVLMENYGKALEYAGISADSAGTALQKFEAYEESIEAKAAGFTAALESLTMDTFDSELVKDLIDTATALVDLTEKAGLLRATLISLGAVGTMKSVQALATGFGNVSQNVLNLGESINILRRLGDVSALTGADIAKLGALTKGLNNEQLKVVLTTQNLTTAQRTAILTASGLTAEEAAQKLETLGLATAEETATGATLSLSNAMRGLGASLKAAFAANPIGMVSLGVGTAITAFSLLNSAIEKVEQAEEEARAAAREGAEAYNDNAAAASEYKDRLHELRGELDKGNLSEKDAYDKRAELVEIEQALIDKFGKEAEGIRLVTGEIKEQIDAIDRLSESEYNAWRRTNPDAIQDAIKLFTDFTPTDLDWWGDTKGINVYPVSSGDLQRAIKDLNLDIVPKEFHNALQRAIEEAGLEIEIPVAGITGDFVSDTDLKDIREYISYYTTLADITEELGKEYFGGRYLDYVGDALSKYAAEINKYEDAVKENADTFNTYAEGQLQYGAEYAAVWREVSAAQQDYNTAVLNGNNEAVYAAIAKMQEARDAFLAAGWDNAAVNRYAEDFFDKFDAQSADYQAEIKVKAVFDDPDNSFGKMVKDAAKKFEGENGKVDINKVLSAGILYDENPNRGSHSEALSAEEQAYIDIKTAADQAGLSVADYMSKLSSLDIIQVDFADSAEENSKRITNLADTLGGLNVELDAIKAHGGTVDLLRRPVVEVTNSNISKVQGWGMTDAQIGDRMTVASQTYKAGEAAIVVTPILPTGEEVTQKALDKYMSQLISKGKKKGNYAEYDDWGILLGAFGDKTTFDKNNEDAEEFAVRLHEIHEAMLDVSDPSEMRELIAQLAELTEYDPSISALADKFADLEDKVKKLSTGMKEFSEDGAISLKTLSDIGETFGDFDSFENFAKTLTDSGSTMEQVQQAANNLASEFVNSAQILDMLRDGNEELVKSMLEDIGVTNAAEVVEARLSALRLEDKLSAMGLADATWEVAKQKLQEAGATETAIASLEAYRKKQVEAKIATTDFVTANAGTIASYLQLAKAAGIAGKSIDILTQMQALEAGASEGMKKTYQYGAAMTRYRNQLQAALTDDIAIAVPEVKVSVPQIKSSGSKSSSSKQTEKYIAEIDRFREAVKRLEDTREQAAKLEAELGQENDLRKQITIQRQLIDVYTDEQGALHNLNEERRKAIAEGVDKLTKLGFEVNYDPATNDLFIENLEHLNELSTKDLTKYETMADMSVNIVGKYSDATEATNGLIKDTGGIIDNITEFNDANKDASESWWELKDGIHAAKQTIIDDLRQIAENAHDAVDQIQEVYDTLHSAADEFAANDGYLTIDTYQSILDLDEQYTQYLRDENGLLVINEENIQKVIAARTEQLALEEALTYVERLRLALEADSIEDLNNLLYATTDATNATWGLVYANLALLDLTDEQYEAAMHNIGAIRDLADMAIEGIGREAGAFTDALNDMKAGLDDILKYTMDMLKQRVEDQIDALEQQKDAYGDIVDSQKEMLRNTKKQADYQKTVASKLREMQKIQKEIASLSLAAESGDRSAIARRAKLQEELADLQEDLTDTQNEHAIEAAEEALDKQQTAFEAEKDQEIKVLQDSISSYQKLYDMAINYIQNHWNTLYNELIEWNTEYGSVLNSEITTAWDNALKAAQRYGSYVSAMNGIDADISTAGSTGSNLTVGRTGNRTTEQSKEEIGAAIVQQMHDNSQAWFGADANRRKTLEDNNAKLAGRLESIVGGTVERKDGTWYWNGKPLYSQFGVYHGGTSGAGGVSTPKQDEVFALLKKGESVYTEKMVETMSKYLGVFQKMRDSFGAAGFGSVGITDADFARLQAMKPVNNVTNNSQPSVSFGDTYIYGGSAETVRQHEEISRRQANKVLKYIRVKR